jgi:hypothetical protein
LRWVLCWRSRGRYRQDFPGIEYVVTDAGSIDGRVELIGPVADQPAAC